MATFSTGDDHRHFLLTCVLLFDSRIDRGPFLFPFCSPKEMDIASKWARFSYVQKILCRPQHPKLLFHSIQEWGRSILPFQKTENPAFKFLYVNLHTHASFLSNVSHSSLEQISGARLSIGFMVLKQDSDGIYLFSTKIATQGKQRILLNSPLITCTIPWNVKLAFYKN